MNDQRYREARALIEMGAKQVAVEYLTMALNALDNERIDNAMLQQKIELLTAVKEEAVNFIDMMKDEEDVLKCHGDEDDEEE